MIAIPLFWGGLTFPAETIEALGSGDMRPFVERLRPVETDMAPFAEYLTPVEADMRPFVERLRL